MFTVLRRFTLGVLLSIAAVGCAASEADLDSIESTDESVGALTAGSSCKVNRVALLNASGEKTLGVAKTKMDATPTKTGWHVNSITFNIESKLLLLTKSWKVSATLGHHDGVYPDGRGKVTFEEIDLHQKPLRVRARHSSGEREVQMDADFEIPFEGIFGLTFKTNSAGFGDTEEACSTLVYAFDKTLLPVSWKWPAKGQSCENYKSAITEEFGRPRWTCDGNNML